MTIHHIVNDYNLANGGAQRLVLDLHKGVLDEGLSSKLFGLSKNPNYKLENANSLNFKSPYKLNSVFKLWIYFKREVKADDVVHVHLFPAVFYVSVLHIFKLIPKCKLILTEHSTFNRRRNNWWGKSVDKITYSSYSKIIGISPAASNMIIRSFPSSSKKVLVINNGAHLFFKKFVSRTSASKKIILSVGRLHQSKNYASALKSISKIKKLDFEYWIAGEGELEEELKRLVVNLGIQNSVKFLGYVKDIPFLLQKADIFLIPSQWEGFGLAAVEAMNASLPSVVANVPGLGDLIQEDGEDAFLVDPSDENIIAERLYQLIKNKELRTEMGKKAFVQSLNFGVHTMIEHYLKLYKEVYNE